MALTHEIISVDGTAKMLTLASSQEQDYAQSLHIFVQNLDQSKHVLIGGSNITTTSYGQRVEPGLIFEAVLAPNDELYALADVGTLNVAVLRITK